VIDQVHVQVIFFGYVFFLQFGGQQLWERNMYCLDLLLIFFLILPSLFIVFELKQLYYSY